MNMVNEVLARYTTKRPPLRDGNLMPTLRMLLQLAAFFDRYNQNRFAEALQVIKISHSLLSLPTLTPLC